TQYILSLLPGLGTRCLRFFSAHLRDRADGRRLWHQHRRAELRDHAYAGYAPAGRVHFWIARGPVRAPHAADDRHHLLLSHGVAHRVFSELHLAANLPRALWNRHGRRMGTRRVAGNGNPADCRAWIVLGNSTTRLCVRLSAGGRCVLDRISILRMARTLRRGSAARISCALHPCTSARIAGLAATAARDE